MKNFEAYVAQLPNGLDSYPEVQHKGSIFRVFLEGTPIAPHADKFPPQLAQLIRRPPSPTTWFPEAHAHALYIAAAELFSTSDDEYVNYSYEANRRLMNGALYSVLFRMLGTRRMCLGAASRWEQLHRGTFMSVPEFGKGFALFRIRAPKALYTELMAKSYATAVRAALTIAGGKNVTSAVTSIDDEGVSFDARWAE